MKVTELSEFELIKRITKKVNDKNIIKGIGDDCAVLKYNSTHYELLTTDTLVEGDHFRLEWFSAFQVGRKAVVSNVSDILSMGGSPKYMLVSLCLPHTTTVAWVEELYLGIYSESAKHNVKIIGGNTTHGEKIVVVVTMLGYVKKNLLHLRSTAKPGELIGVTGVLGGSAAGLALLKANVPGYIQSYLEPNVPKQIARRISPYVNAMIDVSDGLASEVKHICRESRVDAVIYKEKIPLSEETKENASVLNTEPYNFALYGGEDYQLVFTVPKNKLSKIKGCFIVGKILPKKEGIWLIDNGEKTVLGQGYDHFKNQC